MQSVGHGVGGPTIVLFFASRIQALKEVNLDEKMTIRFLQT